MRRQPQARQTKAKARIEAFYKLKKAAKPRPRDASLNLSTDGGERYLGNKVLQLRNVSLKFGNRVMLSDFSYDFCAGDRSKSCCSSASDILGVFGLLANGKLT
jgi:ATP-binding cassette subfamily F protein uup